MAAAKGKLLSKIVKKNVIENIVPIIIHLKHLLEEKHSPLLGPLMQYLTDLMKDYKSEISEIMIADKQLAKELDYDLRQFNIEKSRKKRMSLVGLSPAVARQGTPSVARLPMAASPSSAPFSPSTAQFTTPNGKALPVPKLRSSISATATTPNRSILSPVPSSSTTTPRRISMIPVPSPLPIRLLAPASSSTAPATDILLPSPFKEAPTPRVWGVKLPLCLPEKENDLPQPSSEGRPPRKNRKRSIQDEDSNEDISAPTKKPRLLEKTATEEVKDSSPPRRIAKRKAKTTKAVRRSK